jgi:ABC-type transport system involved in cytochrome bd biosynthesis fused ATPase/permease subunit
MRIFVIVLIVVAVLGAIGIAVMGIEADIAIAISLLFLIFLMPATVRAYARTLADDIIESRQSATEERINRCIKILTWTSKWITNYKLPDRFRILQLRDMLEEMQNPQD